MTLPFFMEKLPSVLAPSLRLTRAPAVLALLSAVAAACTKTVYVPVYQNFPEDTGYLHPDDSDVEVPSEEEPEEDEDVSIEDTGLPEFPLSAEECWSLADPLDLSKLDDSLFMVTTEANFGSSSVVTLRYEEWYGKPLQKEWFYPVLRAVYHTSTGFSESYCYANNWVTISDFAFIVTYDLCCGADTSAFDSGVVFSYLVYADAAAPCERRPFAASGKWTFADGVFVDEHPPVEIPGHEALDTGWDTAFDTAF